MNLTIAILDFGSSLKKCLPRMRKMEKIEPDPKFFMTDENDGGRVQ